MELIVFEKEAYYQMMAEMMRLFKSTLKETQLEVLKAKDEIDWIDTIEAMQLLNIRGKTKMQELRSRGEIVFSKHGKKIKYSKKSIIELIEHNARRAG